MYSVDTEHLKYNIKKRKASREPYKDFKKCNIRQIISAVLLNIVLKITHRSARIGELSSSSSSSAQTVNGHEKYARKKLLEPYLLISSLIGSYIL